MGYSNRFGRLKWVRAWRLGKRDRSSSRSEALQARVVRFGQERRMASSVALGMEEMVREGRMSARVCVARNVVWVGRLENVFTVRRKSRHLGRVLRTMVR